MSDIAAWCRINFWNNGSNPLCYAHHLYSDESTEITDLIIPNIETINSHAFVSCYGLKTVQIPNGVKSIGYNAFCDCSNLTSVNIPSSVTSIEEDAFSGCYFTTGFINNSTLTDSLNWGASIFDEETDDGLLIKNGVVYRCRPWTKSVTIPNYVTRIAYNAFLESGIVSVTMPNSVKRIESGAFYGCKNLTSVTIPDCLTCIESYAFSGCSNLTSITIPEGVDSIGKEAFYGCTKIPTITLPTTLKYLEEHAFYGCSRLKEVYCLAKEVPYTSSLWPSNMIPGYIFYDPSEKTSPQMPIASATLYVPAGSINTYKGYENWSQFGSILPIPATDTQNMTVSSVQNSGCQSETDGVRVAKITLLKEGNILTVNLLNYISHCGTLDFEITPTINDGVNDEPCLVSVGVKPIYEAEADCVCPYNVSFTIHNLESNKFFLSCWWFKGEVNLTDGEELTLSDDTEDVCKDRINYRLDKTNLTAMVTSGRSCTGDLIIPEILDYEERNYLVTSIGKRAFDGAEITSVNIPNSVKVIEFDAFNGCGRLTSVTIGSGIEKIDNAFHRCTSITSFYCYAEKVPELIIYGLALFGESHNMTLYVPAQSLDLYKKTGQWPKRFEYIKPMPQPVNFTQDQMATIILPTAPAHEWGRYYKLDRRESDKIIFEEEHDPKPNTPYIIMPKKDFSVDLSKLDLENATSNIVSIQGVSFIGSYLGEEIEYQDGCYIDIIDHTPDCREARSIVEKSVIGALHAYLRVHWEDPYNPGGTRSGNEHKKLSIVLHDNPNGTTGIGGIQNSKFENQDDAVYDLAGRRVISKSKIQNSKLPKGIYIIDGKKVLVK